MADHVCPGGCGGRAPEHHLSCEACWFRLPKALRSWLNNAYRRRHSDPRNHRAALTSCMAWYRNNPRQVAR